MRLGAVLFGLVYLAGPAHAQDCPAIASLLPNSAVSGGLDATNCQLTDASAYLPYRLDLPARGQIRIDLSGTKANLAMILRDSSGARIDSGASIHRSIEAGSYVLLVNGQTPADLGPYTVSTAFTAEPGMLCSTFPNIGRVQTVSGVMGGSGCMAPDGSPYEAYTLNTDGAGTLTLAIASTDFTPILTLRSYDGRLLNTSAGGTLSALVSGDSQYFVVVTSANKTGAFQLTTSFATATDETCRPVKSISDVTSETGTINAGSCYVTLLGSGDQLYYNYYMLTLPSPGMAAVSAVSADFTATLNLLDMAGNVLATDSGGGGFDAADNAIASLRVPLPAGTYAVQIVSDVPGGGDYSLNYGFSLGNPRPCSAAPFTGGDLLTGALQSLSCRTNMGLADVYSVTLPSAGTLDLEMSSFDFNARLVLRDPKDNLVVHNDDVDGVTTAHIAADLPAGAYTVLSAATSGTGNYRTATTFSAHDIPACSYVQTLNLNGGYVQFLGPNSCRGADGQPVDWYGFTLAVDSLVLAVMTSSEVDGFLTLYDSNGNVVRFDDNSYGSGDPLIIQYLPAGSYRLAARDVSGAGGLYEVDLRTVAGPRPPFCTAQGPISLGGTVTGNITYAGCQYVDGTFADLYSLTLPTDTSLDLRANSTDFDAYLILLDAKGNLVDADDDSGGGTNARITDFIPAGTYFVVVKPVGDYTKQGSYSLMAKSSS
jgi:hypothetical protein